MQCKVFDAETGKSLKVQLKNPNTTTYGKAGMYSPHVVVQKRYKKDPITQKVGRKMGDNTGWKHKNEIREKVLGTTIHLIVMYIERTRSLSCIFSWRATSTAFRENGCKGTTKCIVSRIGYDERKILSATCTIDQFRKRTRNSTTNCISIGNFLHRSQTSFKAAAHRKRILRFADKTH